jgi:intein/homing endonuclease
MQYRVKDFWNWHRDFEIFRARFQDNFERFEEWLRSEKLIERELFLCAYYEKPKDGNGEDLVLS